MHLLHNVSFVSPVSCLNLRIRLSSERDGDLHCRGAVERQPGPLHMRPGISVPSGYTLLSRRVAVLRTCLQHERKTNTVGCPLPSVQGTSAKRCCSNGKECADRTRKWLGGSGWEYALRLFSGALDKWARGTAPAGGDEAGTDPGPTDVH